MVQFKYTPDRASFEELKSNFVGRDELFSLILKRIKGISVSNALNHTILVGPRGTGKTHFLKLLYFTGKEDESVKNKWILLKFSEDDYCISSLADLFLKILEYFCEENKDFSDDAFISGLKSKTDAEIVDSALKFFKKFHKKTGKRIILIFENLQEYFRRISDEELERLRGILIENNIFLIIGSSLSVFKQIIEHKKAFYNFFEVIQLEEISKEEIFELVEKREKFEKRENLETNLSKNRDKLEKICYLTGGNPRLILLFYEIVTDNKIVDIEGAFIQLIDTQTPYYQSIMDSLPPQQAKILETLALMESPETPTKIAREARLDINTVTSQMKRLEEGRFIRPVKLKKHKGTRYEISDRLFRLWREWRTPLGKQKIGYLIKFLQVWYSSAESKERNNEESFKRYEAALDPFNKSKRHSEERKNDFILNFLKSIFSKDNLEFCKKAINKTIEKLGENYNSLILPYRSAINYFETKDDTILESLQQEVREIVLDMVKKIE